MSYDFIVKAPQDQHERFEYNVTYNVRPMLERAGFHIPVVRDMRVGTLRVVVKNSLAVMLDNPEYFKRFNPANGWGSYESVLTFLTELNVYLATAPIDYERKVV